VLDQQLCPDIDVLFVDEAQDLSPLQLALMELWSARVTQTIFAGDSDQSLFRFAGTVPEAFINLSHNWSHHLNQSYRVPTAVHAYAEKIINMSKNREGTTYKPVAPGMKEYKGEGRLLYCLSPDLSLPGDHMILARCQYQVKRWIDVLIKNEIMWHNPYRPEDLVWNPMLTQGWVAARAYCDLMQGRDVSANDFKKLAARVKPGFYKRGMKSMIKNWDGKERIDIFNLVMLGFTEDFIEKPRPVGDVLKLSPRVESILNKVTGLDALAHLLRTRPRVCVGTIHSIKGAESDHVWLDTSLSPIIWREISHSLEAFYDECRVAYVAATRAKQTLGLIANRNWSPVLPQT